MPQQRPTVRQPIHPESTRPRRRDRERTALVRMAITALVLGPVLSVVGFYVLFWLSETSSGGADLLLWAWPPTLTAVVAYGMGSGAAARPRRLLTLRIAGITVVLWLAVVFILGSAAAAGT